MRKRGALGISGRAAGVLDVDHVLRIQGRPDLVHPTLQIGRTAVEDLIEIEHARRPVVAHPDDDFQVRQAFRLQLPGLRCGQLGREPVQHAQVIAALEALR